MNPVNSSTLPAELLTTFCNYLPVADHKSAICVSKLFQTAVINWRLEKYNDVKDFIFFDKNSTSVFITPESRPLFSEEFKSSLNNICPLEKHDKIQQYLKARKVQTYTHLFSFEPTIQSQVTMCDPIDLFRYLSSRVHGSDSTGHSVHDAYKFLLNFGYPVKKAAHEKSYGASRFNEYLLLSHCGNEKDYNTLLSFCKSLIDAGTQINDCKLAINKKLKELFSESSEDSMDAEYEYEEDDSSDGLDSYRELFTKLLNELKAYIETFENRNLGPWQ